MIDARIRDDDEARLFKVLLDLIRKRAGNKAADDRLSTGVSGELENRALRVRTRRNDANFGRIFDGSDRASGEEQLLPCFAKVDKMCA